MPNPTEAALALLWETLEVANRKATNVDEWWECRKAQVALRNGGEDFAAVMLELYERLNARTLERSLTGPACDCCDCKALAATERTVLEWAKDSALG